MSKFYTVSQLLPVLLPAILFFLPNHNLAQTVQIENLPYNINGVAFRGNELWQVTAPSLVKRNLMSGEIEASFDAPGGVPFSTTWNSGGFQSISIDSKGDLWLTLGAAGVARFDGNNQWKIWNPQSTPDFPWGITFFKSSVEASTGHIWIYGVVQNISYCFTFDGNAWKEDVALRNLHLNKFANGPQGEFVFCSSDTLLLHQNNSWVPIPEPAESKYNYVGSPVFDLQGKLWVKTHASKLHRYDNLNTLPKQITSLTNANGYEDIFDMVFDDSGNLYAATYESGMAKWDGTQWSFLPSVAGTTKKKFMRDLEKDPIGRIWIIQSLYSTMGVLTMCENGTAQKNFYYGIPQAGPMGRDGLGNMWFGGSDPLLVRKNIKDGSLDYFEMFGLTDQDFWNSKLEFVQGVSDEIWMRTGTSKLMHFDGNSWSKFDSPAPPQYLNGFCVDSKKRLYVSGYTPPDYKQELKYCDPNSNVWTTVDFSIFGNWQGSVGALAVDNEDNVWFMSSEGLGKRNAGDGSLEIYPLPGGNGNAFPDPQLQVGPGGMIYVMNYGDNWNNQVRLFQFNSLAAVWQEIPLPITPNFNASPVLVWHVDPAGRVWVAVNIGPDSPSFRYWFWDQSSWTEIHDLPLSIEDIASDGKGNVYFSFYNRLAKFKLAGYVTGKIHNDLDDNCLPSAPDQPVPYFSVVASDGKNQFLGLSKPDGTYRVYSGSEQVTVKAVAPNSLWRSCNPGGTALTLDLDQPAQLDLLMQADLDCPHMTVDISTPLLRRCFDNTYTVRACNNGTANAEDAYVDITLPAEIEIKSASRPYTLLGAQQFRFAVGDLAVGACSVFQFVVHVDCANTTIGQTLCVQAHVYPDTICIQTASPWKGATVLLDARCEGDSVRFLLKNRGTEATSQPVNYQMLRNENLFSTGSFNLLPGQQYGVSAPC